MAGAIVAVDPRYYRPAEVESLLAIAAKPGKSLDGFPRPTSARWSKRWFERTSKQPNGMRWCKSTDSPLTTITSHDSGEPAWKTQPHLRRRPSGLGGSAIRRSLEAAWV